MSAPPDPPPPTVRHSHAATGATTGGGMEGLAIASFVLSLVFLGGFGTLLAIVFGHVALARIDESDGRLGGRRLALAGLVIGYLTVAAVIVGLLLLALA